MIYDNVCLPVFEACFLLQAVKEESVPEASKPHYVPQQPQPQVTVPVAQEQPAAQQKPGLLQSWFPGLISV